MKKLLAVVLLAGAALPALAASDKATIDKRLDNAKTVLDQITQTPDHGVPDKILQQATCVGVIPGLKKAAFVVGGEYGQGVVTCRTPNGWSAPAFIKLSGGSFGFQIGGESTDLVLVAVNDKGFQDLLKSKFKIGADAAAAAGPVGRNSQAATDWKLSAELLTYSRSKGLFAGIDLNGAVIEQNNEESATFYGEDHTFEQLLKGSIAVPDDAAPFVRTVAKYFTAVQQ